MPPGGAPDQHVMAGPQDMRAMAEEHAVGGGEGQGIAAALLPGQMARARHELLGLHRGELGEGAVRRLIAPDPLRGGEHRIAAVALLVVAVGLVAMNDDLVADLPAPHLVAHRPDHARGIGARDVIGRLMDVEGRDGPTEPRPDAVVVDARGHHHDQHLIGIDAGGGHHLDLEGLLRRAMTLAPDRPGIHARGDMAQRRDLADLVEILLRRTSEGEDFRCLAHDRLALSRARDTRRV